MNKDTLNLPFAHPLDSILQDPKLSSEGFPGNWLSDNAIGAFKKLQAEGEPKEYTRKSRLAILLVNSGLEMRSAALLLRTNASLIDVPDFFDSWTEFDKRFLLDRAVHSEIQMQETLLHTHDSSKAYKGERVITEKDKRFVRREIRDLRQLQMKIRTRISPSPASAKK